MTLLAVVIQPLGMFSLHMMTIMQPWPQWSLSALPEVTK